MDPADRRYGGWTTSMVRPSFSRNAVAPQEKNDVTFSSPPHPDRLRRDGIQRMEESTPVADARIDGLVPLELAFPTSPFAS